MRIPAAVLAASVLACATVRAATDPPVPSIYDDANNCILATIRGTPVVSGPDYQVDGLGSHATTVARRMAPVIRDAWALFHEGLGTRPDGGRDSFRIYFVPRTSASRLATVHGFIDGICGAPNYAAIVIDADDEDHDRMVEMVWHQVFHAYQHVSTETPVRNIAGWWSEATAVWAAFPADSHARRAHHMTRAADAFLAHPETPLDAYATPEDQNHALGAFLYVQWLERLLGCHPPAPCVLVSGEGIWPVLRESFRRIEAGEPQTDAIRAAMDTRPGRPGSFDNSVAEFWADSLGEHRLPRHWTGPFAPGVTWTVSGSRAEQTFTIQPLAAVVLHVAVSASPARIDIYAQGPPGQNPYRVYGLLGSEWRPQNPVDASSGRGRVTSLCAGPNVTGDWSGNRRGTGSTDGRWPGELPITIVNTGHAPESWRVSVVVSPDCLIDP